MPDTIGFIQTLLLPLPRVPGEDNEQFAVVVGKVAEPKAVAPVAEELCNTVLDLSLENEPGDDCRIAAPSGTAPRAAGFRMPPPDSDALRTTAAAAAETAADARVDDDDTEEDDWVHAQARVPSALR
jgi:hypothetical protein